jgi:hypothetical protein
MREETARTEVHASLPNAPLWWCAPHRMDMAALAGADVRFQAIPP